jgi:hypothetical protein
MLSAYPLAHILLSPQSFLKETFLSVDLLHTPCSRRTVVQSDLNLSQCTKKETQPERESVFGEKIVGMIDFSSSCLHGNLPWPLRVLWAWEQMPAHTQNVQ